MDEIRTTAEHVPTAAGEPVAAKLSTPVGVLAGVTMVAAGVAALLGLFGTAQPVSFTTVRGQPVDLFGSGLYRYDSVFSGAGNRGTDVVTLLIALPLLALAVLGCRRGSLRWQLVLTGALAYFLYVSASVAVGAAFNQVFLVYVVVFGASLWGFILSIIGIDRTGLTDVVRLGPRRPPAVLMIVSGVVTAVIWVGPVLVAQFTGTAPERLESYTTLVTVAIDCAVIAPAAIASGFLIWLRRVWGYLMAAPLLILLAMLAPLITAQTLSQLAAGVVLTPGEVVGPVSGFAILALAAVAVGWPLLRRVPR
jgi:hypothetical protein